MRDTEIAGHKANEGLVREGDALNFEEVVLEASKTVPVIVDFWAPWCGPCKQLTPALEKAVRAAGGAVRLVKINIDKNPQLAHAMRIQSVPVVYAFRDGRAVDGFVGALPESQVRAFVDRIASRGPRTVSRIDDLLEKARAALDVGKVEEAAALYRRALAEDGGRPEAVAGALRCHLAAGKVAEARAFLDGVAEQVRTHADVASAIAALELAEQGEGAGDERESRARLERNENDHRARLDFALALFGAGRREEAIDELLEIIRRDREWNDHSAQKQLLKMFEAMGPGDPLTRSGRQRLSALLFV